MNIGIPKPVSENLNDYISIARPDHWFKNIFMLPGMMMAYMYYRVEVDLHLMLSLLAAVASTCCLASANYVINEWLYAEFDRYHPLKKNRPSVVKNLNSKLVYLEYGLFAAVGLTTAAFLSFTFFLVSLLLLVIGFFYHVRPFRTKERAYLDVLSESDTHQNTIYFNPVVILVF